MNTKKSQIAGWVLSFLIAALLIFASALAKFTEWPEKAQMFEKIGYSTETMAKIGIVEVALTVLFLIPRTAFLGAMLLTGYLGGATATHVRVGEPFIMPILVGFAVWVALGLRRPMVFALAFGALNSKTE